MGPEQTRLTFNALTGRVTIVEDILQHQLTGTADILTRLNELEKYHDPEKWGGHLTPGERMLNEKIGLLNLKVETVDLRVSDQDRLVKEMMSVLHNFSERLKTLETEKQRTIDELQDALNPCEHIHGETKEAATARLDETSSGLVNTLHHLIDTYGFRGVQRTLEDIHLVYHTESETPDEPKVEYKSTVVFGINTTFDPSVMCHWPSGPDRDCWHGWWMPESQSYVFRQDSNRVEIESTVPLTIEMLTTCAVEYIDGIRSHNAWNEKVRYRVRNFNGPWVKEL